MTISYKWLCEYLPEAMGQFDPQRLSKILTSIGLEVESLHFYEEVKGGLKGLIIGQVISAEKHPNADKLKLTSVNTGGANALQIVCGAPNVAAGQKVIVAPVGTTIYPLASDPMTMKVATIRNVESHGMICAEDEIGLGSSHAGILVLPADAPVGTPVADYYQPYEDWIFEIGLTPNHMDAMSHWGVARDVCVYLSHHDNREVKAKYPTTNDFPIDNSSLAMKVDVENPGACPRYSGISIANLTIKESPRWLQQKLKAIGLRPINNIVDITNFIQHETGQPLHAFDADSIKGKKLVIKNLPEGTPFVTLDGKERTLGAADLMICDAEEGMCIAGVYGGLHSGVTPATRNIFLESACFEPIAIRKTSSRLGLKTDAASRFEKGTDISATVTVLKRAALLIRDICGGTIASPLIDIYPNPRPKKEVTITYAYLRKLSGKTYPTQAVKKILASLEFELISETAEALTVAAPYHKPDIQLPADIVEEVLRIDGLDNIDIPEAITITPSIGDNHEAEAYQEKVANYLVGLGFFEILTNSITNNAFFDAREQEHSVFLLNHLSADLNTLRPSMVESGLGSIAHNLNRRNHDLRFFEFGKTYKRKGPGDYEELEHLCLYITGNRQEESWRSKPSGSDLFVLKGVASALLQLVGVTIENFNPLHHDKFESGLEASIQGQSLLRLGMVSKRLLDRFDIRQPVFFADFDWQLLLHAGEGHKQEFREIPRFPAVQRDLAIVVPRQLPYEKVEQTVQNIRLNKLRTLKLFDIFESEKLGAGKKSMAINFTFLDEEKTLTDKEIENWMGKIIHTLETELQAEIRK